jgi:regulator of sigma E protease
MSTILNTALNILEFVIAFGVLVFIHELGHFIVARLSGIEVEEFGFGFPPKMVKLFRWKGTDFTLNWIPFGGFCRMKGENAGDLQPGSFAAAKPWRRLVTLLGGPFMNLLLGFVLVVILFMKAGSSDLTRVQVVDIAAGSPAATANFQVGDIIAKINGDNVTSMDSLSRLVKENLDKTTEVTLQRGDQTLIVELIPRSKPPEGQGAMGVTISNPTVPVTFFQAVPQAALSTLDQGVQLIMLPVKLITGQVQASSTRMVSVVGLYDMYRQVKTEDAAAATTHPQAKNLFILSYLATLSIALGYTNLLPIPAIDGGRILFLLPELLFKRKVRPEIENNIHLIGFSLLILLMVVLVINDVVNPITLP